MILIADSGSTKTDWRLSDGQTVHSFSLKGYNPFFNTREQFIQELSRSSIQKFKHQIKAVSFYGAGLAEETEKVSLGECLRDFFDTDDISVNDDLLASARALFGDGSGIVCILGTGSNSCLYVDGRIVDKIPPLGYILGDEGSGAGIGKAFLNALLKRGFSEPLRSEIMKSEKLSQDIILENVYRQKQANTFLASLTQIISRYIQYDEVKAIIRCSFEDFYEKNISKYRNFQNFQLGFTGSIAFHFKPVLLEVLESHDLIPGRILKAPIDKLLIYHLKRI